MNILVTGAGSLVGHGILRSLRAIQKQDFKIFTADPDHRSAGHWLGDHGVEIPFAKEENYLQVLQELIQKYKIDILFVGTDTELMKIAQAQFKIHVIVSSPEVIAIGEDKWLTVEFLKKNGFPFPDSTLSENRTETMRLVERHHFPLFGKPRIGARSVGAKKIQNMDELEQILLHPNYIVQEHLPDSEGEFTAGTMTYNRKSLSSIIFRRDLKDGNTYRAYLHENEQHENFIVQVSEAMDGVYGPLNFQYRLKNGKPVIFEINSRYSGTTPLRTAVGINEVEMALEYIREGKISRVSKSRTDVAILRTWSDIIVPLKQLEEFNNTSQLQAPQAEYFPFMNK